MNPAIRVEHVSKKYRIGALRSSYPTLRDRLASSIRDNFMKLRRGQSGREEISVLNDVSFDVGRGEVVGLIGANGAGKSTMLKILSRITEPTDGRVELYGRVGSLLEVGTGFHPELTGRENIFLNSAILGMKRAETLKKFDEIVAFSEIEKFIDTPVKHYSSGMYMRLAFSVAAHLNPEILLVDEVLAVGDAAFQQKCLGKMEEVAQGGRTVLFVSHNIASIQRLCNSVILLESGRIAAHGGAAEVSELYLKRGGASLNWIRTRPSAEGAYFERVFIADETGREIQSVTTGSTVHIMMECVVERKYRDLQLSVALLDSFGEAIFGSAPQDAGLSPPETPGRYRARIALPPELLLPKTYGINAGLWLPGIGSLDLVSLRFTADETASLCNSTPAGRAGKLAIHCHWEIDRI